MTGTLHLIGRQRVGATADVLAVLPKKIQLPRFAKLQRRLVARKHSDKLNARSQSEHQKPSVNARNARQMQDRKQRRQSANVCAVREQRRRMKIAVVEDRKRAIV